MLLPKSAQYAYLKDDLGLMQLVTTAKDAALSAKLIPRYPLLGGWSTEMILGYSLPLPSTVAQKEGVHTLTFLLGPLVEYVRPSSVKRCLLLLFAALSTETCLALLPAAATDERGRVQRMGMAKAVASLQGFLALLLVCSAPLALLVVMPSLCL
jgi:hypothetical protein